jgi:CRISPR system Cascade subunit CasD
MTNFLVFQLYGNLSAWGDIAVGEFRPTQDHPSKSAIMGLLAASIGIKRDEDSLHQQLSAGYGMAVCVLSHGEVLRDYHTTQVPAGSKNGYTRKAELSFDPLNLKTILSQRDYQMDALYLVALWLKKDRLKEDAPYTLDELSENLKKPQFITYLGRKSCPPGLPYYPQVFQMTTLKQACKNYPCELKVNRLFQNELIAWYWEDGLNDSELGMKATMTYPRRDQLRSRKHWQFSRRDEYYCAEMHQGE